MKTTARFAAIVLLGAALTLPVQAGDQKSFPFDRTRAETNLLVGIASDNAGLRLSAASIVAEVGTDRSVIPLIRMLHNGTESERLVAALALSRIGNERGVWAVRRAAQFDPSEKVQRHAAWYYMEYAAPKPEPRPATTELALWGPPEPYPEFVEGLDGWSSLTGE